MCVTSPPYWGQRDYDHPDQIGLERTVGDWVKEMVKVFREVRRVLRDDGTLWLNLGDSYTASGCGCDTGRSGLQGSTESQDQSKLAKSGNRIGNRSSFRRDRQAFRSVPHKAAAKLPSKNLIGLPWIVAFALQADGWILRSDIIWHKPNPMPESVTDRPTKSHEYIFLFSKRKSYFYDMEAIKEPVNGNAHSRGNGVNPKATKDAKGSKQNASFSGAVTELVANRNKRTVWTVPTFAFPGNHYATFPPALIKPCILAGCPTGGVVLDPFGGSGTAGMVALELGRRAILVELNPEYAREADQRCHVTPGLPLGV